MKLQPFNLELWLHLGRPDCVHTANGKKVIELHYHEKANSGSAVLSGLVFGGKDAKYTDQSFYTLKTWYQNGCNYDDRSLNFKDFNLRLYLDETTTI